MNRTVLFVDPPAFCTAVESMVAPALRERPVVVAAPGADRATVLALSPEARAAGITRGLPVSRARKLCPDLIIRPPNPQLYARASRALHQILARYAPIIEPHGYGHAYLDITGTGRLFGPPVDVGWKIHRESREQLRLRLAVGVAQNKLVSEAAADVVKGRLGDSATRRLGHELLLDVPMGTEAGFLAPEPVSLLPDLEPRVRDRLDDYQLEQIGEIQAIQPAELATVFGRTGWLLADQARGIDGRPVLPPAVKAEFRAVHTLGDDTNDLPRLLRILRHLTERLGARLRGRRLIASRMTVHLAYTDYTTAKRHLLVTPGALDHDLWLAARRAFLLARTRTVALRAVGVVVDRFLEEDGQLELFAAPGRRDATSPRRHVASAATPSAEPSAHDNLATRRLGDSAPRGEKSPRSADLQSAVDRIRTRWGGKGVRVGA